MPARRDATIGPYRVLEHIGSGAHGDVFLALDHRLQRRVAIKTVTSGSDAAPAEARRRLMRESRAAARLTHPHIAAIHDVVEADDAVHIVMEYAPGQTLAARLRQGPLPPMQVVDLGIQLSDGLAHAHGLGVIHRDLKPANIVISEDGQAKILDFGLATVESTDSEPVSSDSGSVGARAVGTPPYMPPEHLLGSPVDARGDVYSLGVTLFEALTGRRPFEARGAVPVATSILTSPTPRPRSLASDISPELDDIVFRAIARDPTERISSARELHDLLKRLSHEVAESPTRSFVAALPTSRPRSVPRVAGAAFAVALAGAVLYWAAHERASRASSNPKDANPATTPHVLAVLPLVTASPDTKVESLSAGMAEALITTLSKVPGVTVISRAATLKYRDRTQDPDTIAKELGATLLLDGNVQSAGERLRVTLSLLRPGSKVVNWQGSYDGTFAETLSLQSEVATGVATALAVRLSPADRERLAASRQRTSRLSPTTRRRVRSWNGPTSRTTSTAQSTCSSPRSRETPASRAPTPAWARPTGANTKPPMRTLGPSRRVTP